MGGFADGAGLAGRQVAILAGEGGFGAAWALT
jgi:hypothetical protein